MKHRITTGSWDGEPIMREETAEETLVREMGFDAVPEARTYIGLNETYDPYKEQVERPFYERVENERREAYQAYSD